MVDNLGFLSTTRSTIRATRWCTRRGTVDTLFAPVPAPWFEVLGGLDFVRAVAPRRALDCTTRLLNDAGHSVTDATTWQSPAASTPDWNPVPGSTSDPMHRPLDGLVQLLYRAPRRVRRRPRRRRGSRPSGRPGGGPQFARLRKPTVAAWLVNLLALRRPELVADLVGLAEELRSAQRELRGARLRDSRRSVGNWSLRWSPRSGARPRRRPRQGRVNCRWRRSRRR